jgi:hypothetical protein
MPDEAGFDHADEALRSSGANEPPPLSHIEKLCSMASDKTLAPI